MARSLYVGPYYNLVHLCLLSQGGGGGGQITYRESWGGGGGGGGGGGALHAYGNKVRLNLT